MIYDVDETDLYNVGIALITKKNTFKKDKKEITYYEIIDCVCGFLCRFEISGVKFVSLSKYIGDKFPLNDFSKADSFAWGFINFDDLCLMNNNKLDVQKFISAYKKIVGTYYFYDASIKMISLITDEDLIQQIKNSKKAKNEFDENDLNENSNISKILKRKK